ncbi:MAG TPA: N-acetylmuramic acid 6-phosphate etherase [Solirubrobacteraceae bacterium]|nr:N-acetylmuramic acid 6-phosphate etherase [Solirubrobacteraceae bacterium]
MGALMAAAWQDAYRGVVPDAVLEAQTAAAWERELAAGEARWRSIVAVDEGERIVGFTRFGADPDGGPDGYLASLYVDPAAAGAGIGGRLLQHALGELAADGRPAVTLWVFRDNPRARDLYVRHGFLADGAEVVDPRWRTPQLRFRRTFAPHERTRIARGGADGVLHVRSPTEERNPRTADIDTVSVLELLQRINDEDALVPGAVRAVLPALAALVELTVERIAAGGRVHYFGAGSSGRLGLLDAAELPPTFGVGPDLFIAHLAGGDSAVRRAREGAEDDAVEGAREAQQLGATDVLVGLASSGYTAYVGGAMEHAREAGAHIALVTSNPHAPLAAHADTLLCVDTGPEVITGSTRLKAATSQKLILNAYSTAVMVRTGRTWSNLMVDLVPSNAKLRGRVLRLLAQATGEDEATCGEALERCDREPKTALVILLSGAEPGRARAALAASGGRVALALRRIRGRQS